MPRASEAHTSEVRQRILAGARTAMLAGGYRGTSMPTIATEAGVSVGLIYRYFASKEELYLAMCESVTAQELDELAAQLAGIPDPAQRLESAVHLFVDSLRDEDWGPIVIDGWAEVELNPRLRDLLRRRCDQIRGFAALFIRELAASGVVRPDLDVETLSLATAMLLDGVIAHKSEMGERFDPDAAKRAVVMLLSGQLTH